MTETTTTGSGPAPRIFRGWWVLVGVFIMMTTSSGLGFYNVAVMLEALTHERGFSVAVVSGTTAFFFVVSGVAGLFIARLLDRFDVRVTIVSGALLAACGLLLLGRVSNVRELFGAYAVFGLGFAGTSLLPGTALVTRWFIRRRSVALSLATTGLSLGGIVVTPISAHWIATRGLEGASPLLAVLYLVGVVPAALLLIRSSPASMELAADGDPVSEASAEAHLEGVEFGEALRSRFFLAVTGCYIGAMLAQVGAIAHQFNFASNAVGAGTAATAVAVLAGASIGGRLTGGWIVSIVPLRTFALAMLALQSAALWSFSLVATESGVLGASLALGLTVGNLLMLQPLLLAAEFGVRDYAKIYSIGNLLTTFGVAGGPVLMGWLHDEAGGYTTAFRAVSVISLVALVWLASLGRPAPREA